MSRFHLDMEIYRKHKPLYCIQGLPLDGSKGSPWMVYGKVKTPLGGGFYFSPRFVPRTGQGGHKLTKIIC